MGKELLPSHKTLRKKYLCFQFIKGGMFFGLFLNKQEIAMPSTNLMPEPLEGSLTTNNADTTDLFMAMEAAGIDVDVMIEIAAHDLINQFGDDALLYSIQIEQDFTMKNNIEAMLIWKKISTYLHTLNGSGKLIAH